MADLVLVLLAAAAAAFGARAAAAARAPAWARAFSVLLFAGLGIHAVLLAWLTGHGEVLPGWQLSPGLKSWYVAEVVREQRPGLPAALLWLVLAAHGLLLLPRPDRARLLRPLPATLLFLALLVVFGRRAEAPPIRYERARGPERVAYLTVVPAGDGARVLVATGEPNATFLDVLVEHRTESAPPPLALGWTADGAGVFVYAAGTDPTFVARLDGGTVGALPAAANEWPRDKDAYVPPSVRRRFTQARVDTLRYLKEHGGVHGP